jgi:O-antigen ligase
MWRWRLFSFFGYQNIAAQYLIFPVLWGIGLSVTTTNVKTRLTVFMCTLLIGTALVLTFTRGAIISVMLGAGLFLFCYILNKTKNNDNPVKKGFVPIACMVIAAIVAVLLLSNALTDGKTFEQISFMFERGNEERFTRWGDSVSMIQSSRLTGVGLGNYAIVYPLFKTGKWTYLTVYAHNEFLHMAAETGLVGLFGLMVFLIAVFIRFRQQLFGVSGREEKFLFLAILCSCIATLVHSVVSYNLHSAVSSYFFFVGTGILCAQKRPVSERVPAFKSTFRKNTILLTLVAILSFSGIYAEYKRIMGHYFFSKAISSIKIEDNESSVQEINRAVYYQPYNYQYHVMLSSTYRKIGNRELSESHFQKAKQLAPYHYNPKIVDK